MRLNGEMSKQKDMNVLLKPIQNVLTGMTMVKSIVSISLYYLKTIVRKYVNYKPSL